MIKTCSVYEFTKFYGTKNIYCVGAGKIAREELANLDLNIVTVIDNDFKKWDTTITVAGKTVTIKSWDYLKSNVKADDVILISMSKCDDILIDILEDESLRNIDTFIFRRMLDMDMDSSIIEHKDDAIIYKQKDEEKIPRCIHYFWFSGDPYPDSIKRCIDSWHKFCPDFEIKKWDLDNYSSGGNLFFEQAISKRRWQFASDFARADVIYRYGGIYLDSDVEIVRNIDDLLYHDAFIGFETDNRVDPGSGFGAGPGNPVIGAFRDIYADKKFILEDGTLNTLPCPSYYTEVLAGNGLIKDGSYQLLKDIAVYPTIYFAPHSFASGALYVSDKSYSIHHHAASWHTDAERAYAEQRKNFIKKHYTGNYEMKFDDI